MPWNMQHTSHCRGCGKPREPEERYSARGKCVTCGEVPPVENMRQLKAHNGPLFDHWRIRTLAAFGVTMPGPSDEPERS